MLILEERTLEDDSILSIRELEESRRRVLHIQLDQLGIQIVEPVTQKERIPAIYSKIRNLRDFKDLMAELLYV